MCEDADLMSAAFTSAQRFLEQDPEIETYPPLRKAAERMFTSRGDIIS